MTKKKKFTPVRKYHSISFQVEETHLKSQAKSMPSNLAEEKEKFLKSGKTPKFQIQDRTKLQELASKSRNQIRFDLLGEAEYILEKVKEEYGNGELYLEHAFGPRITSEDATPMVLKYIDENALTESLKIYWCNNLTCSAKMMWTGPVANANKPEWRKYSLWINGSAENNYMRESGIRCLMDHEIGTHFFRTFNDGFQPWFSDRARFGLRSIGSFDSMCAEEGLAAIHTVLRGRAKLLWGAALAYYTACKSAEMNFKQLFDHIGRYSSNQESRWKQVMRVKRGLADPNDLGGFGNDQCYFEGAVNILRNIDSIDFYLLMMGKLCPDELDRIKRVARKDVVRFPNFMKNMEAYKKTLKKMCTLNGLDLPHFPRNPPQAFLKRLTERKGEGGAGKKNKKVRAHKRLQTTPLKNGQGIFNKGEKKGQKVGAGEEQEVKSFSVSNRFINTFLLEKMENERKAREKKALETVKTMSTEIKDKDESMDKQIKQMQEIVRRHSWSSKDLSYKQNLFAQAYLETGIDVAESAVTNVVECTLDPADANEKEENDEQGEEEAGNGNVESVEEFCSMEEEQEEMSTENCHQENFSSKARNANFQQDNESESLISNNHDFHADNKELKEFKHTDSAGDFKCKSPCTPNGQPFSTNRLPIEVNMHAKLERPRQNHSTLEESAKDFSSNSQDKDKPIDIYEPLHLNSHCGVAHTVDHTGSPKEQNSRFRKLGKCRREDFFGRQSLSRVSLKGLGSDASDSCARKKLTLGKVGQYLIDPNSNHLLLKDQSLSPSAGDRNRPLAMSFSSQKIENWQPDVSRLQSRQNGKNVCTAIQDSCRLSPVDVEQVQTRVVPGRVKPSSPMSIKSTRSSGKSVRTTISHPFVLQENNAFRHSQRQTHKIEVVRSAQLH